MNSEITIKKNIENVLKEFDTQPIRDAATQLLDILGYRSKRISNDALDNEKYNNLLESALETTNPSKKLCIEKWQSYRRIMQITDEEIKQQQTPDQQFLFESTDINENLRTSYMFVAVELDGAAFTRTQLANITRFLCRKTPYSIMVMFRYGDYLSLAIINRRHHKQDKTKQVLEKVTLIKDINLNKPIRAHIEIIYDLYLRNLILTKEVKNFDTLHDEWEKILNTEELNKKFYQKLFAWYEWTVETATFPTDESRVIKPEEHVIRLITRLLFIWFIKEKGLVADELFSKAQIQDLLTEDDFDSGDSYYRAVLQNLFFATLNTEIDKRTFSKGGNHNHRNFSRYRYKKQMPDSDKLLSLFAQTPFINGGLFDCLDSFKSTDEGGYRIDCFSDVHYDLLSVPNRIFFDENRGLIPLLEHYKFTVEENTPIDQEVALDPELLGRVFENLLAAINPETGETARKMTGSYYTPRAIVDYMVDETLVATLSQKCQPTDDNDVAWDERLRYLFDYAKMFDDASEWFDDCETDAIVKTISELKILDPAVGSGAFPMGMLHKLTLALRRLDPDNTRWEALQKQLALKRTEIAYDTQDDQTRREELIEIDDTFKRYRDSDFGRKLYLIQNSIFGVDIQPIACQIAKLRFFISLAIEQEPDIGAENFGIKPLPNLETRFVAANTLIGINLSETKGLFEDDTVQQLLKEIDAIRERFFLTNSRGTKRKLEEQEEEYRAQLENELERQRIEWIANRQREIETEIALLHNPEQREQVRGKKQKTFEARKKKFDAEFEDALKIARWKPYDQNAKSDWFAHEWMFGVTNGFDVVLGNPPYINIENLPVTTKDYLFKNYQACKGRTDIYIAFLEKSISILNGNGFMSFILPLAFAMQKYGEKMREILIENHNIREIVDASSYRIFENAVVYNIVLIVGKHKRQNLTKVRLHYSNTDFDVRGGKEFLIDQHAFAELKDSRLETNSNVFDNLKLKEKIWKNAVRLDQICLVAYGARLNHRSEKLGKTHYISQSKISGSKPFCEGKNIERYSFTQEGWLNYTPDEHYNPMFPELFENKKLMFIRIVKDQLRFAYDNKGFYNSHTVINCVRLDLLADASHITARRAVHQSDYNLAKKFNYKYVLGILNSVFTNWYFCNFLSDNLNFYPNHAKELPIPNVTSEEQLSIIELVDKILDAKHTDPEADTSDLEDEIDKLVFELYNFTEDEIAIVEGSI